MCFDYCFLRDQPGGESVLVLVGWEKGTKVMLAQVVPFWGGEVDLSVGQLLRDLRNIVVQLRLSPRAT